MNISVILAGGTGSRLGSDIPKQYLKAGDKMIIEYCIDTILENDNVDSLVIVADEMWREDITSAVISNSSAAEHWQNKFVGFSTPGANRQLSIWNAMQDIRHYVSDMSKTINDIHPNVDNTVLIHDAARPGLTAELLDSMYLAIAGHDGVMPILPMKDTVYLCDNGNNISGLLDRSKVFAGQAPELFKFEPYYNACEALLPDKILVINGSTEPAIIAGMDIVTIPGDEGNYKITTKVDLDEFIKQLSVTEIK